MENILLIGAHYDDVELGCGGTAAKLVAEGKNVYKLTLTNNETSSEILDVHVKYEDTVNESKLACDILGVKEITEFEPCECCELEYNTRIMQRIEALLYKYKIDTVFIHYNDDLNHDHISASQICSIACRHCSNVFMYQSNIYIIPSQFAPNFFFDISDYIDKKKEALNQYSGDNNRNNVLFQTNIERNHIWGVSNKTLYAEGFVAQRVLL